MRVAHFGTFDIENFGDLLFPLIVERRLAHLGAEIVPVSPLGGPPVWDGCPPSRPVEALGEVDGIVLGGGNLVHAGAWNPEHYDAGGATGLTAYPRLWLGAALAAARQGIPLAWNAPGVPRRFAPPVARLAEWAVGVSAYVSVRDRTSAELLVEAVPGARPEIVPDPALEVSLLWTPEEVDEAYAEAFRSRGRELPDRALAVHLNARYLDEPAAEVAARLDRLAAATGACVVLLALGPCHGDDRLAREVGGRMGSEPLVVAPPAGLREAAALIGRSAGYAGSSMHGMVCACSFGVPGVIVADQERTGLRKFSGFLEQFGLGECLLPSWERAEAGLPELLGRSPAAWRRVLPAAGAALDAHWRRIGEALEGGARLDDGALAELSRIAAATADPAYTPILADVAQQLRRTGDRSAAAERRLGRELEDVRARLAASEARIAEAQAGLERRDAAEAAARAEATGRAEALEQRLASERTQHEALQGALDDQRATAERLEAELRGRLDEAARRSARLQAELGQAGARASELERRLAEVEAALEEAAGLREQLERRDAEAEALRTELERTREAAAAELAHERRTAAERARSEAERARGEVRRDREEAERQRAAAARTAAGLGALREDVTAARAELTRAAASKSWRWGHGFFTALRRLTLRAPVHSAGGIEAALARMNRIAADLEQLGSAPVEEPRRAAAAAAPPARRRRLKISFVSWDMGHNPLTRSNLLAEVLRENHDVEICGALFERYGDGIWPPLRGSDMPMRTFPGQAFPEHFRAMEEMAATLDGDVIYVSKPRIPSYGLGILAKELRNRPLILDSDDRELSFFPGVSEGMGFDELAERREDPDFLVPYGATWTRYCDSLIGSADHFTVSNEALAGLYGGMVIPHVRDERTFDPRLYDRDEARRRFGLEPDQRVVLFAGTPRAHKGIQGIAGALRDIGDRRNRLLVIGTVTDRYLREQLEAFGDWITLVPYQPFTAMPALLRAADLMCVLQDPESEIARYQAPAKVTDAIAMGIPCLTTRVPPLAPLIEAGAVETLDDTPLAEKLGEMLDTLPELTRRVAEHRATFEAGYSYGAVRGRLEEAIERLVEEPPPLPAEFSRLLDFQREQFTRRTSSAGTGGGSPPAKPAPPTQRKPRVPRGTGDEYDIVMFWKQNDTGIYGRRQDMLLKYLAGSDRVRKVVHFDHPLDPRQLRAQYASGEHAHQGRLVVRQTLKRVGGLKHDDKVGYHTFLHRPEGDRPGGLERALLPSKEEYPAYVASVLARHGLGHRRTVFWVYPRNFEFPALAELFEPDLVVADVMDDHRTWVEPGSRYHEQLTRNYRDILGASDVVLANCAGVRDAMAEFRRDIHVLPNACELPGGAPGGVPRELRRLRGPVVGYVGNLSSRIDIPLLDHMARARPEWNIVLVGSAHLNRDVLALDEHANVHFLGVRPYEEVKRLVAGFDVAIIPHVDNEMTQTMNPLKAFVYCAHNVPVVSSPVANLDEMRELIDIASGPEEFVAKVDAAIARGRPAEPSPRRREILAANSWERRVEDVLGLLDTAG